MRSLTFSVISSLTLTLAECGGSGGTGGAGGTGGSSTTSSSATGGASSSSSTSSSSGTGGSSTSSTSSSSSGTTSSGGLAGPYAIAYAGTSVGVDSRQPTSATFNGSALDGYVASDMEKPLIGTAKAVDIFGDTLVLAGRWEDGTTAGAFYGNTFTFPKDGGFQYVIGDASASLPASGSPAYTLTHGSPTTISDGSIAPGTATGTLGVAFAGDGTKVGASFKLVLPGDQTYDVSTTGGSATPATSEVVVFPPGTALVGGVTHLTSTTAPARAPCNARRASSGSSRAPHRSAPRSRSTSTRTQAAPRRP